MADTETRPSPNARVRKAPKRKWLGWVIVLALVGGGYYWYVRAHSGSKVGKMITAKVTRGDLTETVTANGSVVAQTGAEVHIGSQITGVIKALHADVGQEVKAHAIIAELDLPDLTAQLRQAQASMAAAQEKATQAQTTLNQTTSETLSQVRLSQAALESSRQKYLSARATASQSAETVPTDVLKAESGLASATAALTTAKSNLTQVQAGAALQGEQQLLATVSTAEIALPDPVAYRRDWRRYRIRLTFGTPPGEIETREIAAPEPPPPGS